MRALAKALGVPVGESVRFRAKAKVRSREQILAEVSKQLEDALRDCLVPAEWRGGPRNHSAFAATFL